MLIKLCIVTSTRADYGILSPLIRRLKSDPAFQLTVAATGTHLLESYGYTVEEIIRDGIQPVEIPIMDSNHSYRNTTSEIMAKALVSFSRFFSENGFDLLILLGDRFEIEAIACAAVNIRLPIAHLHGGETTQGAIDECYRHAITKMSWLHFPACERYRQRIIQMGEQPQQVYNVGALCVENIKNHAAYSMPQLEKELSLPLVKNSYAIVTYHPVTQEQDTAVEQLYQLMKAMEVRSDLYYIITKSNADEGGEQINQEWEKFGLTHHNCAVVSSLGMQRYLTALRHSRMIIGNSSSGIIEAPVCSVPTVNIGDRQKGRLHTAGIIDCIATQDAIVLAMAKVENDNFIKSLQQLGCPYGDGQTSQRIVAILKERLQQPICLKKQFYDLA